MSEQGEILTNPNPNARVSSMKHSKTSQMLSVRQVRYHSISHVEPSIVLFGIANDVPRVATQSASCRFIFDGAQRAVSIIGMQLLHGSRLHWQPEAAKNAAEMHRDAVDLPKSDQFTAEFVELQEVHRNAAIQALTGYTTHTMLSTCINYVHPTRSDQP